jgi:hypothetical protein
MWLQASSLVTPDSGSDKIDEKGTRQMGHESSALMRSLAVRTGKLSMMGSMRSIIHNRVRRTLIVELLPRAGRVASRASGHDLRVKESDLLTY